MALLPPCSVGQAHCGSSEGIPQVGGEESDWQEAGTGGGGGGLLCHCTVTKMHDIGARRFLENSMLLTILCYSTYIEDL